MNLLPPSPLGSPPGSGFWNDWYEKLRTLINTIASGFSWTLITDKPTTIAGFGITDGVSTSATLTTNAVILGAGSHTVTALGSLGTTTTLLHGNAAGAPTFGAVTLTTDVTGTLPVANGGTGVTSSTGTVAVVLSNTPTLITPVIGAATGTSVNLSSTATATALIPTGSTVPANGIYLPSANNLGLATNTTLAVNINSTGQFALQVVGKGFSVKEGSNAKQGISTMTAGAVTVSTTAVTASSRIFISINDAGSGALTNIGSVYVNNIIAATSFDIRSTNVLDTSSVVWLINEPS